MTTHNTRAFVDGLAERDIPVDLDAELLQSAYEEFASRWVNHVPSQLNEFYTWVCQPERFDLDPTVVHDPKTVDDAATRNAIILGELVALMEQFNHPDDDDATGTASMFNMDTNPSAKPRHETITRVAHVMYHARQIMTMSAAMFSSMDEDTFRTLSWESKAITLNVDEQRKPHQESLLHVLRLLAHPGRRYRKYGGSCYSEIYTEDGHRTHAWKRECTIKEFIYRSVTKECDYPAWKKLTDSFMNPVNIAAHLEHSYEAEFPWIEFSTHLFAFRNGLFDVRSLAFYPFDARGEWDAIAAFAGTRYRMHKSSFETSAPTHRDVAVQYFDSDFDNTADFADIMLMDPVTIPCPEVEKVLADQELDPQTIEWFFAGLGRLLFPIGEMDNWQVVLFIKGVAGCGKSTIAQLVKSLYTPDQVGVLSSNAEDKFGLAPLRNKKLIICPEVKKRFAINQGDLQSMISGEDVSVAIKHQEAESIVWKGSMLFCGNEIPDWRDASNSMARRVLMFIFAKKIDAVDTGLFARMKRGIDAFLFRIALTYHRAVIRYGDVGIWGIDRRGMSVLPPQLHAFHSEMMNSVQPLLRYIKDSGEVRLEIDDPQAPMESMCVPEETFIVGFKNFCKTMGIDFPQWNRDTYSTTFEHHGIRRVHAEREWQGEMVSTNFLLRVTLK